MLYFLIMKGNELHVHEVHPRDEETFRLFYDEKILVEGASIRDVLRQFDEMPLIINYGWQAVIFFKYLLLKLPGLGPERACL